jgi:hypothetical protein
MLEGGRPSDTSTTSSQSAAREVQRPFQMTDTGSVPDLRGLAADQRYTRARQEWLAATESLAAAHRRRTQVLGPRPVLDPEYEVALDRLDAAEAELRRAYELGMNPRP